jgi:HK97 family phage major capsid protein
MLTKEGLLKALRAEGLPETATDLPAVEKWLAENPRVLRFDGKDVDLKAVFAKTIDLGGGTATATKSDDVEIVGLEDKIEAAVQKRLARMGIQKDEPGTEKKVNLTDDTDALGVGDVAVKSLEYGWHRGIGEGVGAKRVFATHAEGYAFGCYLLGGALAGFVVQKNPGLVETARKHYGNFVGRMERAKGYLTFPTSAGGALTGTQFETSILQHLNDFGAFTRAARVVQMTDTTWSQAMSAGYLTISYPDEGVAPSTTQQTWSNVTLRARMGIAIVKMSRQINADAIANLGDHTARELARGFARQEDLNGFLGNGTGTYGGMSGLVATFGATATADSRSVTGGGTTLTHTEANLIEAMAKLPSIYRAGSAWHCTPEVAAATFDRLGAGKGGVTWRETQELGYTRFYLGRPVIENNVMNANLDTGGDVVDIYFGDLSQAVIVGRRQNLEIEMSDQRYWDEHNLAMKGVIRHDQNCYNLGSTTAAGGVIAIFQT